jgi:glycine/D-amino acid oxidase-like deaminating enzyme
MDTKSSRRTFLKGSSLIEVAYNIHSRAFAGSPKSSAIVVGAGAFGGWSALQLIQRGAKVTLLDAWGPGNSRASSGGETRTIRATYGPAHPLYTKMVARALQMWQDYERRWNLKLFFRSGALRMAGGDDSYERAALPVLKKAGIRFEKLSAAGCAERWPQVNFDGVSWSVYEPDSGFLAARRGCEAVLNAFLKQGGRYLQAQATPGPIAANRMHGISISSGEMLTADYFVFAPGPWLGKVFPFLASTITPTRQEVFFFGTPAGDPRFNEEQLPTWIDGGNTPFANYGPEDITVRYSGGGGPCVDGHLHPGRHRNRPHAAVLPVKINYAPSAIPLLHVVHRKRHSLHAGVAQVEEHRTRNAEVGVSNTPSGSSRCRAIRVMEGRPLVPD